MKPRIKSQRVDYFFVALIFLLVAFGLAMLASASSVLGKVKFNDSYFYLKHQIIYGLLIGLLGFFVAVNVYYRRWEKMALIFLLISLLLLILVFSPLGFMSGSARRWISIGSVTFQPSEIIKLTFLVYLAAWLSKNRERSRSFFRGFLPFLFLVAFIAGLLVAQNSASAALIFLTTAILVYFISGAKFRYILAIVFLGLLSLPLIIYVAPYRWERIITFLNPQADPLGYGYQINQTILAIGSGKLWGRGYGQSIAKIHYLPEQIGDSIFAVIAEELGFGGVAGLIAAFFLLIWRSFIIANRTSDGFAKLLVVGFSLTIGLQVFVHIAALTGIIPLTGVPLPFISYGGTALAVFLTMAGIIVNISKYE